MSITWISRPHVIGKSDIEWTDYALNHYYGCEHGCTYCYARDIFQNWLKNPVFLKRWGLTGQEAWPDVIAVKDAPEIARRDAERLPPGRVLLCSMTDPYRPAEAILGLTRAVLEAVLPVEKHHYMILTKNDLARRDFDLLADHPNVEFGMTITNLQSWKSCRYEPGATPVEYRRGCIEGAHDQGIKTFVSMEPWIPSSSKHHPNVTIELMADCVDRWIIGSYNHQGADYSPYYQEELPKVIDFLVDHRLEYYVKKELLKAAGLPPRLEVKV